MTSPTRPDIGLAPVALRAPYAKPISHSHNKEVMHTKIFRKTIPLKFNPVGQTNPTPAGSNVGGY